MMESLVLDLLISQGAEAGVIISALVVLHYRIKKMQGIMHRQMSEKVESVALRANGFFDKFLDSFDFPAWVKRVEVKDDGAIELRMHFINRAYETEFGKSRVDYVGKTDFDVWNNKIAAAFYGSDVEVLRTKAGKVFREDMPGIGLIEFKKFYVFYQGSHWIVGFAMPVKKEDST